MTNQDNNDVVFAKAPENVSIVDTSDVVFSKAPDSVSPYVDTSTDDWSDSGYGFKVRRVKTHNGYDSYQREDGGIYYGPDQKNTGKAGWFNNTGMRLGDTPTAGISIIDRVINHEEERKKAPIKTALKAATNTALSPIAPGMPVPKLGGFSVVPTTGGTIKGAIDAAPALVQSATHALDAGAGATTVTLS